MKLKTLGRIGGATVATAFGFLDYCAYEILSSVDSSGLNNFLSEDYSVEQKILTGAYLLAVGMVIPISKLGIIDGITDVVKGTHHYFGCKLWKHLTKNEQTKKEIDSVLEKQLKLIEKQIW